MTIQEFLDWVKETYELPENQVVLKTVELLDTTKACISHWKNGRRKIHPSIQKLMVLTIENHALKKK